MKQSENRRVRTKKAAEKLLTMTSRASHRRSIRIPSEILGPHWIGQGAERSLAIRAFRPGAQKAVVVVGRRSEGLPIGDLIHPEGHVRSDVCRPTRSDLRAGRADSCYRLSAAIPLRQMAPRLKPTIRMHSRQCSPNTICIFPAKARTTRSTKSWALTCAKSPGVKGVHFAVWAPNAQRVSVVGDFNLWDGRANPMRNLGPTGIWEIFMPGLDEGALYKFEILSRVGHQSRAEIRPLRLLRRGAAEYRLGGLRYQPLRMERLAVASRSQGARLAAFARCRFTKFTRAPGGAGKKKIIAGSPIASWPRSLSRT